MKSNWPKVPLNKVVVPIDRGEKPISGKTYRQIGVRLWGEGAYEREPIDGINTKYKQLYKVEKGNIIVNKIWARNGSVAVVSEPLAGCYASGEFPIFSSKPDLLEPQWMHWLTKTSSFWDQCDEKSRGTSGKNRIRPERFLEIGIPLPPLAEQKRIVARIERLAEQINEARALRQQAIDEAKNFFSCFRTQRFSELGVRFENRPLGDLITMTSGNGLTSSQMDITDPYPVYGGGGLTGRYSRYMFEESKVVIGRVGARCGCVFVTEPKAWITDNALYLTKISEDLYPPYLVHALATLDLRQQANQAAQPVVSQKKINPLPIAVPPLTAQRRIVEELETIKVEVDKLERFQAETSIELDEIMPSILDRAFKGEL